MLLKMPLARWLTPVPVKPLNNVYKLVWALCRMAFALLGMKEYGFSAGRRLDGIKKINSPE